MSALVDEKQSRRDFLRGSVRYLTLGGLIFMGGALFARQKTSSAEEKCINQGINSSSFLFDICRGCSIFKNCGLPPASAEGGDKNRRECTSSVWSKK
jgi:hypothetical protein